MFVLYLRSLLLAVGAGVVLTTGTVLYNLFLHPLRSFPGPWQVKSNVFWFAYQAYHGSHWLEVHKLHLKYGPIVRIAPNELSFIDASAWKDIYGHRSGKVEFHKDPSQTFSDSPSHPHIIVAPRDHHSRVRKILSHGFSDAALREQEKVLTTFVRQLVGALANKATEPVDIVRWYNYTTFDIIGHLVFAESFGCLGDSAYHPWVTRIFETVKYVAWGRMFGRLIPGYANALISLIPEHIRKEHNSTRIMVKEKLQRRQQASIDYIDFSTKMLEAMKKGSIDEEEVIVNMPVLVVAGSETTATALSGITYYLLKYPETYRRLTEEIRSKFDSPDEVNMVRAGELKYLAAVIEEGLRMYPPGNHNHPRVISPEGAAVCGTFVPGNTLVGIPQYACFNSPLNFADPDKFVPERSLNEDERYANDRRDALQPFQVGPRNCIGRNLAFIEMRLILIHILLAFDIEKSGEHDGWTDQKTFLTWQKKPLMVRLLPRQNAV